MDNHRNNQEEDICNAMLTLGSVSDNVGDGELLQNSNDNSSFSSVELMAHNVNDNNNERIDMDKLNNDRLYVFDEDTFKMLKSNDPECNFVCFEAEGDVNDVEFLSTIDWERDGNVFANNAELKQFQMHIIDRELDEREKMLVNNLLMSIARSREIQRFDLELGGECNLDMAETISILSPFIENNTNLRIFSLYGFTLDSTVVDVLASALSKNKSLFALGINRCNGMTAEIMTQVVDAVEAGGIQRLFLREYNMENKVAVTLGRLLCISNTIKVLDLSGNDGENEEGGHVGSITSVGMKFISAYLKLENPSLIYLNLSDNYIGEEGAKHLAEGLTNNSTLKSLYLKNSDIRPRGGLALAEALRDNSTLELLDLFNAISPALGNEHVLADSGWDILFTALKHSALRRIDLGCNDIKDSQISSLVDSINTMLSLDSLGLGNVSVTSSGWMNFFTLLQQTGNVLERLTHLNIVGIEYKISDEVLVCIANALAGNTSLVDLCFDDDSLTETGWSALERTLCNKSSIDAIYDSNHTLERTTSPVSSSIICFCMLNRGTDKTEVARQKIIQYHFLEGNGSNMHGIMKLDLEMMPHVIGFFGSYDIVTQITDYDYDDDDDEGHASPIEKVAGLELIYRLTRGMPSLFE